MPRFTAALPMGRNGIQRQVRTGRLRAVHGTGFGAQQVNLQTDFQLYAETGILGANIPAGQADTGHDEQAAAPAL